MHVGVGFEEGIAGMLAAFLSMFKHVIASLVDWSTGAIYWTQNLTTTYDMAGDVVLPYGDEQWSVAGNIPDLTSKGSDIVGAIMTIVHNGLVFVAQLSTLLPAASQ